MKYRIYVLCLLLLGGVFASTREASAQVADPVLAVSQASSSSSVSVTVSDATAGASIYYTTDGTIPTTSSTPITSGQAVTLSLNTTLKVRAFQGSLAPSSTVSGVYTVVGLASAGTQNVMALKNDGTVWAWGSNSSGQLGTGNQQSAAQPVELSVTNAAPIVNSFSSNAAVQNGIPVAWLEKYNLVGSNPNSSPDGNGLTLLQDYQQGNDPTNYFSQNGTVIIPVITIVNGNNQIGTPGAFLPQSLVVKLTNGSGIPLPNAPLAYTIANGGGGLASSPSGTVASALSLTTDSSGQAVVYFQIASGATGSSQISVSAGTASPVTFTEGPLSPLAPQISLQITGTTPAPSTVTLTANVSSQSSITSVQFYEGQQLLGTVSAAPYTLTLSNVVAGFHTYMAVAMNSAGYMNEATSNFTATVAEDPFVNLRYTRGTGSDPSFQTFVIALNQTTGAALDAMGNNAENFPSGQPWFTTIANSTAYHTSVVVAEETFSGGTYTEQQSTYPASQAFQNPVVAFGAAGNGTPLYTNQSYAFGFGSGGQDNSMTTLQDLRIRVYAKSSFGSGQTNVAPVATFTFSLPRQNTNSADWNTFAQNGYRRTYTLTSGGTTYPLTTTFQYAPSGITAAQQQGGDSAYSFSSGQQSPFILTHTASSSAYYYEIDYEGVANTTVATVSGSNVTFGTQEIWMAMANSSTTANQYSTSNSTGTYSLGYTLDFTDRPTQVSAFISQPQFQGTPVPSAYAGMSIQELLNQSTPVTYQFATLNPSDPSLVAIDSSPELREHPVLDKLVSDLGNNPMAIANYVLNNIQLTDALSYNRNGDLTTASINCGGVNRGALATYMEKQGNPIEQCALLIYLLRKCSPAVPCGYVFPSNNTLQMLDQRMSSILRMQLHNAVDPYGNPIMPQIIPVNYPWVVAYINGQWIHIFPWMKDTDITEGYDLNPLMPGPGVTSPTSTGYQSGLQWMQNYVNRDPAILSLSSTWDDPGHLYIPFVEKYLALYNPTISLSDVGIQAEDRQNTYSSWSQFPQPWGLNGSLSATNFQAALSTTPTIFNTIDVSVWTTGQGNSTATSLFDTGAIPALYFHDRRIMVHETQNGTGSTYTMGLSLAPFRPGTSTVGNFSTTGDMVNKQVLSNASLPVSDVEFYIMLTYQRNLNMPAGFTQPTSQWNQFLGVIDTQTITSQNYFFSGDLVTYCLDFGRVTQEMLDSHAQTYWNDQQAIAQGQSSSVDPDDLIGEPVYLMGLSLDKACDDFQVETQFLYKEVLISQMRYGAAKINAQRNVNGALPNGQITLLYPCFDADVDEETDAAYGTSNAGTSEPYPLDSSYLRLAGESANEHTIINTFWNLTDSASAVHVLDVAQEQGHPIAFLTSQNYATQGAVSYTATVNGTSTTQALSAWAGSTWTNLLVPIFENDPYSFAYLTPGDVTCANGSYTGMGYLIADGVGGTASLLAFNQQQIPINGGTGPALPATFPITTTTAPNWNLYNTGQFYTMSYTPATTANPTFATGSFGNQSFNSLYTELTNGTAVLSSYDIANAAATNANLGFTNSGSGGTLQAAQLKENLNTGSFSFSKWIAQAWQKIGEPVDVIDGSFNIDDTDLSLPGPLPIQLRRNYSSLNQVDNEFGYGWKLSYEPYLVVSATGALIWAAEADGSVIAYRQQASPNTNRWVPQPSDNPSLVNQKGNQSGSLANAFNNYILQTTGGSAPVYTLYGVDGSTRTYATASYPTGGTNGLTRTRPYLTTWQDSSNNTLTFTIGSTSTSYDYGKLNRITSSNGNYIQFDYDQYGHIITANASDGRQLTYTYDTYGDLTSVTRADGTVVSFTYQHQSQTVNSVSQSYSDHLLLQENKPDGRQLANTFDSSRRVTEQQATVGPNSTPQENASFSYSNTTNADGTISGTTTVTAYQSSSLNYATTYTYANSEITQIKDPVNPAQTQTWYTTSNSSGAYQRSLQQRVDSRGLTQNFLYDTNGNVKETDTVGDLTGSGTSVTQTTTATYNAQNLPTQVSDTSTGNSTAYTYGSSISPYLPTLVAYSASGTLVSQTAYTYENVPGGNGVLQQVIVAQGSPDAAETDYTYTPQGYVASETHHTGTSDPNVSYTYAYDPCGRVSQKTDAAGRSTQFGYDALDHLISTEVYDQSGGLAGWHYDYYDDNGELQWTNGPRFSPDDYIYRQYDGGGRLTEFLQYRSQAGPGGSSVQQASIATTSNQYDFFGDLMLTMDPNGNTAQMAYDGIGQMLSRQRYDSGNNLLGTESFTYEPGGKIASHNNPIGGVTQYAYTQRGQLKKQTNPDGSTQTWTYQLDGRLSQVVYPNGAARNITYNDSSRSVTNSYVPTTGSPLTESETYDRRGNLTQRTDVAGYTTTTAYDALNRVKSVIGPPAGNGSGQQSITHAYDNAGIVDLMTDAAGETTRTTYDALSRPVEVDINSQSGTTVRRVAYSYSSDHQSVTSIDGTNTNPVTTTTDIQGQPVLVRKADGGFVLSQYDLNENLLSSTDELGRTTVYTYDGLNRVAQQLLPDGAVTAFGYDAAGDLQARAMPAGLTWSATYDSSSRKLTEKLVQGTGTTRTYGYTYYPTGELDTVTDPRSIVRTYGYDGFDRVQTIAAVDGSAAELGVTQTYSYDPRGLVTELDQTYQNSSVSPATSVVRTYDGYGAIAAEQTYINGTVSGGGVLKDTWQQTHDNAGRRTQLTETNFAATPFTYGYQADGSLVQTAFNGQNYQYSFGPDGLLTSRSTPWVALNVISRDPVGRITEQRQSVGGNSVLDEVPAWQADSTQGNWSVARTGSGTWNEQRLYTYDLRSHLASETYFPSSAGNALLSYQFDGNTAGGLGQRTIFDVNSGSSGSSVSTYGSFARLNQVSTTGLLTSPLGTPVNDTYDAVGQLSTHDPGANTDTLVWDAFGRLVGLQRTGTTGFSWKAVYDGFGRRLQTTTVASGSGITVLAQSSYDPEVQFLELAVTVNAQREWLVHGPDLTGGYGDLQGTGGIDAVVNPSASTATGIVSDVYGHVEATVSGTTVNWNPVLCVGYGAEPGLNAKPLDATHDLSTFLAWRSKYIDPSGLYYLGNRYYDPQSGTFVSADPLGHAASMSLYDYCNGDPLNRFDPDGLLTTPVRNWGISLGYASRADAGWVLDTVDNSFYGTTAWIFRIAGTVDSATQSGLTDFSSEHSPWNLAAQAMDANGSPSERMGWYKNNEVTRAIQNAGSTLLPLVFGKLGLPTASSTITSDVGVVEGTAQQDLLNILKLRERQIALGTDPVRGFIEAEGTAGVRLEQALGRTISRGTDVAVDFVDSELGPISLKGPIPAQGSVEGLAAAVIRDAMGGNTATRTVVVDTLGLSQTQVTALKAAIEAATQGTAKTIIYLQ